MKFVDISVSHDFSFLYQIISTSKLRQHKLHTLKLE